MKWKINLLLVLIMISLMTPLATAEFDKPNWFQDWVLQDNTLKYCVNNDCIEITPMVDKNTEVISLAFDWEINETDNSFYLKPNFLFEVKDLPEFHWKVEGSIRQCQKVNQYSSQCVILDESNINYDTFIGKNTIKNFAKTYNNISSLHSFYGIINDLDPVIDLVYDSSDDLVFTNQTEGSSLGARLDTPILFMDFDDAPEGTYVKDNSIYNNYGTNKANYNSSCDSPASGNCFHFNSTDTHIDIFNSEAVPSNFQTIGNNNDFTIASWIMMDAPAGGSAGTNWYPDDVIVELRQEGSGVNIPFSFGVELQNITIGRANAGGGERQRGQSKVNDGAWHHVAVVMQGNDYTLYVDGANDNSGSFTTEIGDTSVSTTNSNLQIGCRSRDGGEKDSNEFVGNIDQVQIWDRALTSYEIVELYNGTITGRNNSDYIGKYSSEGSFDSSFVFYNATSTYWNVTFNIADTYSTRSGLVNADNTINTSDPNLVSYWALDDSCGGVYDDCTGTNDGTPTATHNVTGISSEALWFEDGSRVASPSFSYKFDKKDFSVSAWFKTSISSNEGFLGYGDRQDNEGWTAIILNGGARFIIDDGATQIIINDSGSWNDDNWHHYTATIDNINNWTIVYVDGNQVANSTIVAIENMTTDDAHDVIDIGGYWYQNQYYFPGYFNGSLDEIIIYNDTLSQAEITQLYKAGLSQHANTNISLETRTANNYNLTGDLIGLWSFNNDNLSSAINELKDHNATCVAGDCPDWSEQNGTVGEGAFFDCVNQDRMSIPSSSDFEVGNNSWSISAWSKIYGSSTSARDIFSKYNSGDSSGFSVAYKQNTDTIYCYTGGSAGEYTTVTDATFDDGNWHHVVCQRYNLTNLRIHVDGVLLKDYASATLDTVSNGVAPTIGDLPAIASREWCGSIDELKFYNKSLETSEIQNLYELGSYHIEWADWTDAGVMTDGVANNNSGNGTFYQFRANFNTNDTRVSPYIINHSVGITTNKIFTPDVIAPNITFNYQDPIDINNFNTFENGLNISYNITDDTGIDASTFQLWEKINDSVTDVTNIFLNGSREGSNFVTGYSQNYNVSDTFHAILDDNEILPGTYNYPSEAELEAEPHFAYDLDGNVEYLKVQLLNVSNIKNYSIFEFMANNQTANTGSLRLYYCNSTYSTGNPVLSDNCIDFYNYDSSQTANHTHFYSNHSVAPFPINGSGFIGDVLVTNISNFLFRSRPGVNAWNVYYIPNGSRAGATELSINAGLTWTEQTFTIDAHLHQFDGTETVNYFISICDNLGNCGNSTLRTDKIELGGIPPSSPNVYNPTEKAYNQRVEINWTKAISGNGYSIDSYNISLINLSFHSVLQINISGGTTLGYNWNSTAVSDGEYYIRVTATDSNGLSSFGDSENITIDNTAPSNILSATPSSLILNLDTTILNWTITGNGFSSINYWRFNYTDPSGNTLWQTSGIYPTATPSNQTTEGPFATIGTYTLYLFTNDTLGNSLINTTTFNVKTAFGASTNPCGYKKFGYFNLNLPFIRGGACNESTTSFGYDS